MLLIPSLGYITLRSAGVQNYLANKAAEYLSKQLGAKVSVGGVNIAWFMNVVLEDITLFDKHQNAMIYSSRLVFNVNSISFSRQELNVNNLIFDQASLAIVKYPGESNFNFRFLVDYFDTEKPADTFSMPRWDVQLNAFEFKKSGLSLIDHNELHLEQGFDPNRFAFGDLNILFQDISLVNDTLRGALRKFSVEESGGLQLKNISADLMVGPRGGYFHDLEIVSQDSRMEMNIDFSFDNFSALSELFDEVEFEVDLKPSSLRLYELGYFFSSAYGIDHRIEISGGLRGRLSNIRASDISIHYGNVSGFRGGFNIIGLPNMQETFLNFSVEHFVTSKSDLEMLRLPDASGGGFLGFPEFADNLGLVTFTGNFTGFIYDFVAYGRLSSALGVLSTDIAIISNDDFTDVNYRGSLSTTGVNLGLLLDNEEDFGVIAFNSNVSGSGYSFETFDLDMEGIVKVIEYKDYNYRNLEIAGQLSNKRFSGNLLVDDPNLFVDFKGLVDFSEKDVQLNFSAQVDDANLSRLNIYQRDSLYNSIFSTILVIEGKGNSLNTIEGEAKAYKTAYREVSVADSVPGYYYEAEVISLQSTLYGDKQKRLDLKSDFLDMELFGEINLEELGLAFQDYIASYAPARFKDNSRISGNNGNDNGFSPLIASFYLHLKESQELSQIFFPQLEVAENTIFEGNINTSDYSFQLEGFSEYVVYGKSRINDLTMHVLSDTSGMEFRTDGSRLFLTDSIWMERFTASGRLHSDSLAFLSQWDNAHPHMRNYGHIEGVAKALSPAQTEIRFSPSYAYVNDSLWALRPTNRILIDSAAITIEDIYLHKNDEFLRVNGILSDKPEDELTIELNDFNVESLAFLLHDRKVHFAGVSSGELVLSNMNVAPNITAALLINDFAFNHDHLGDLSVNSVWDASLKAFKVDAEVIYYGNIGYNKPIVVNGYLYPEREHDNFDLDITIENLRMSMFSRYLEDFASDFRGLATGTLRLDGPLASPELSGSARLARTGFRVDYINVPYSFAHEVEVGKDYFRFDNLVLNDTLGNSANVSGMIRHNNFFDFSLDVSLWLDRLAVLNTRPVHNELFYGKAFASGLFRVHGPVNDIVMDISARANRGTQIFLPLDYRGELTESNFISFVSPNKGYMDHVPVHSPQIAGLTLNFDLEITPDSEVQIIFDSQIGDILRGRGFGDLTFEIDNQGVFNMYGDYTIQDGDYLFTLQNLINKRFRIEQGGTIRWSGDPYDADIDIRALYRLRTSLYDLAVNQTDTSDVYRRRVPVETVLHLEDKLFNPSISFDISLPGGDESTREMIERIITTEQEMNRQVFSLLILNRFVPPEDGFNTALSYGMGSTSSELLSNQLSNWLSQISSDFDIGINYRPGDEISSQEIEVALSTQLFDDRVVIDGNVGVAGDHPAQTQRASNIIGDVNIEVKITPEGRFRVKAFNRSNTFDVLNTNAPYTQGVGVFYRREFDNLGDLFRRRARPVFEIPEFEEIEYPEVEAHQP